MRLYTGRTRLRTFMQHLIAFCSRPEAAREVVSSMAVEPIGLDVRAK